VVVGMVQRFVSGIGMRWVLVVSELGRARLNACSDAAT
jgi:hypothetical protein